MAPRKEGRVRGGLGGRGGGIVVLVRGERTVAVGGGLAGGCLAEFLSIEMQSRHHEHSVYVGSTRPIRGGGRRQAGAGRDRDGGNVGAHRDSHLEMCDAY